MNIEQIKIYLAENPGAISRISSSEIGIAIKKGRITPDAAAYILAQLGEDYDARYFMFNHIKMSFKEGVSSGFFAVACSFDDTDRAWDCVKKGPIFTSVEDLVSFIKAEFNVDITDDNRVYDPEKMEDREGYCAFLRMFFYSIGAYAFTLDPNYKTVYTAAFPYIVNLYKDYVETDFCSYTKYATYTMEESMLRMGSDLWAVDFDKLVEMLDTHIELNCNKVIVIFNVMARGLDAGDINQFPLASHMEILDRVIPKLREYMGARNFPVPDGGNYDFRNGARYFYQSLFGSFNRKTRWGVDNYPRIHAMLEEFMDNATFKNECSRNYYICAPFLKAYLRTGAGRTDINELFQKMSKFHALHAREAFKDVAADPKLGIRPTDEIVDNFIQAGVDWSGMVFNLDKLYNWDYIKSLTLKLGNKGVFTGNDRWDYNEFFAKRVEVAKLPMEFFKYTHINWSHISTNERMTVDFIETFWDYVDFRYVPNEVAKIINVDLAKRMLEAKKVPYPECRTDLNGISRLLRQAPNLPIEFLIENFQECYDSDTYRRIELCGRNVKLADLVKSLQ